MSNKPGKTNKVSGNFDARSRAFAKELHKARYIYALYGLLDGMSLSYSMFKYSCDLLYSNTSFSSSDMLHEHLGTPSGALAAGIESVSIIALSFIGQYFEDDDKNPIIRNIAVFWPYLRDAMKGVKNGYKGINATVKLASVLHGMDLGAFVLPIGLALGAVSVLNRLFMRHMRNLRKEKMKINAQYLAQVKASKSMTKEEAEGFLIKLNKQGQSYALRAAGIAGAALSGVVDGLYLYMGAITIAPLALSLLVPVGVICILYTIICIATRIYEEYRYQEQLEAGKTKVELAVTGKEIETLFNDLMDELKKEKIQSAKQTVQKIKDKLDEYADTRKKLKSILSLSYKSAILSGLRDGLAAYGALSSVVFAAATICAMLSVTLPPLIIVTAVFSGLAILLGFVINSVRANYKHKKTQEAEDEREEQEGPGHEQLKHLSDFLEKEKHTVSRLKPEKIKETIAAGLTLDESPQFYFQEWFEVTRSLFSGVAKGQKTVDFTLSDLQEQTDSGHYHDTPVMLGVTVASSLAYSSIFALRAHTKGFGRIAPGTEFDSDVKKQKTTPSKPIKPIDKTARQEHMLKRVKSTFFHPSEDDAPCGQTRTRRAHSDDSINTLPQSRH